MARKTPIAAMKCAHCDAALAAGTAAALAGGAVPPALGTLATGTALAALASSGSASSDGAAKHGWPPRHDRIARPSPSSCCARDSATELRGNTANTRA